ncbi:MAG: phosphoribosyl-AMP cyclohydrolase [Bacteroidota bacterium]
MESQKITEQEILDAQKAWGEGIVSIGKVFLEKGDYRAVAEDHIKQFYNYGEGSVLFKPTLVSQKQFRLDFAGALSYFVGGDSNYPEDHGFAIKPWSAVNWENIGTKIIGNMAIAMGNYYFTMVDGGDVVKVEYSFSYTKNSKGELKIILHGSHIPYSPPENS